MKRAEVSGILGYFEQKPGMTSQILSIATLMLTLTLFSGCLVIEHPHSRLAPGTWRGVLKLDPAQASRVGGSGEQQRRAPIDFEEVTAGELPFLFEVVYDSPDSFHIVIVNGEEKIEVRDIRYGLDRSTAKDTLVMEFPLMDSRIEAVCESGVMQGHWIVQYKEDYRIPFEARFGEGHRFTELRKPPALDLSGSWAVVFEPGQEGEYPALGEFVQNGNQLTGTFRTETGDFRFLEGTVQANKLYLSCFDGSHAYLFEGKIMPDSTLQGIFRSGSHYLGFWQARRDAFFRLADPDTLTKASTPGQKVSFRFPDPLGRTISTDDPEFAGKPLIIQILGTWCPNCLDESRFLRDFAQKETEVKVIGIAFERYRETELAAKAVRTYSERLDLPYPVLLGGYFDKKEAAKHVPFLQDIKAYPTMVFLDKEHRIARIHTGFDGPATSGYRNFTLDFNNFVQSLKASQ